MNLACVMHHEPRPSLSTGNAGRCRDLCHHHPAEVPAMTDEEWSAFYETMMSTEDMLPLEDEK